MTINLVKSLLAFAVPATILALSACGTRTETEKTTIIERKVESPPPSVAPAVEPESGHLQRAGEKIDAKVDRKIDEAIDDAIGD
jgi:hypothetical protein